MPQIQIFDLFSGIPANLPAEWFHHLAAGPNYKIERIVSRGHVSAPDFWYDQTWDEWVLVLKGYAVLGFAEQPHELPLRAGSAVLIPAGCRHRISFTDPNMETIWLAVHLGDLPAGLTKEDKDE